MTFLEKFAAHWSQIVNKTEHAVHSYAAGQGYVKENSAGNICNGSKKNS